MREPLAVAVTILAQFSRCGATLTVMPMDWADSPVVGARSSWAPVVLAVFVAIPLAVGLAAWLTRLAVAVKE